MTLTQIGAALGSFTGVASLTWNIYVKLSAGPKLRIQAFANMVMRPAPQGDPHFLRVSIQNTGSTQTTLTNYGLNQYGSKRRRFKKQLPTFSAVLNYYQGAKTPYKLGVGEEATILMEQNPEFEDELDSGKPVYFAVWHAFSKQPIEVPIIVPNAEKQELAAHASN